MLSTNSFGDECAALAEEELIYGLRDCRRNICLSMNRPCDVWPQLLQRTNIRASSDVIE